MSHYPVVLSKDHTTLLFELFNHHNGGKYAQEAVSFHDVIPYTERDGFDTEVTIRSLVASSDYDVPTAQLYYTRMDLPTIFSIVTCDVLTSRLNPVPNMPKIIEDIGYRYGFNISEGFEVRYNTDTDTHTLVALEHNLAFTGEVVINEVRALDGDRVQLKTLDGFRNIEQSGDIGATKPPAESNTNSTRVISTAAIDDRVMVLYVTPEGKSRSKVIDAHTGADVLWGSMDIQENSAVCADNGLFYVLQCRKDPNSRDFLVSVTMVGESIEDPSRVEALPEKKTPYPLTCPKIHVDNNQLRYISRLVVMAFNVNTNYLTRTFSINGSEPQIIPGIGGQRSFMVMSNTGRIFTCDSSTGIGELLVDHRWENPRKFDSLVLQDNWDKSDGPIMVYDDDRTKAFSISPVDGSIKELSLSGENGLTAALQRTKSYSAAGCITNKVPVAVLSEDDKFSVYPLLLN